MADFQWEQVKISSLERRRSEPWEVPWERRKGDSVDHPPVVSVVSRAKVPGGWFIRCHEVNRKNETAAAFGFFYPDPKHEWDGGIIP